MVQKKLLILQTQNINEMETVLSGGALVPVILDYCSSTVLENQLYSLS